MQKSHGNIKNHHESVLEPQNLASTCQVAFAVKSLLPKNITSPTAIKTIISLGKSLEKLKYDGKYSHQVAISSTTLNFDISP